MLKTNKNFLVFIHRVYIGNEVKKGSPDYIISFLLDKGLKYLAIEHPLKSSNKSTNIVLNDKVIKTYSIKISPPLRWVFEVIFNVLYILFHKKRYDFILAIDPLNFISAYILKLFGISNRIYFQSIDYSEQRFKNKFMDFIYGILYKFAIKNADIITYSNDLMLNVVKDILGKDNIDNKVLFHLPHSPEYEKIIRIDPLKKDKFSIVFTKTYIQDSEIKRILNIVKELIIKYPKVVFHIVGQMSDSSTTLISTSGLTKNISLYGLLGYKENMNVVSKGYIGFSWYENVNDHEKFGDSLKIREYAASGIVTVSNNKVPTCQELKDVEAGIVINNEKDIGPSIARLFSDFTLYSKYRYNALSWAKRVDKKKLLNNLYIHLVD